MSVLGSIDGLGGGGKTVIAEMPVVLPHNRRKGKQKSPQEHIDEFWGRFTTKAPGKATTIIPHNQYAVKLAKRVSAKAEVGATATHVSYEEAAALCRAKVAKIVRECRRVNQRYRDPHFDLEFDLKMRRRDCLESLDNMRDGDDDSSSDDSNSSGPGRRRRRGGRSRSKSSSSSSNSSSSRSRSRSRHIRLRRSVTHRDAAGDGTNNNNGRGPVVDGVIGGRFNPMSVKRVTEIFDEPMFYIDGPTANDVRQGRDGDCWLMAALCTLSNKPGLIERVCVARDEAVGVYGFVFHRDGEWFSEIIDDKLYLTKPDYDEGFLERILWEDRERVNSEETYRKTYQSNSGALYFAQCEHPNETWLPLLEKAYAKAHGDYAAIEGGFTGEGIEDLTGGVTSELFTTDILDKEYFWKEQLMKVNDEFLFGCSTAVWGRTWGERRGIVELHAYSVMKAVEVDGMRLLLLKNPWGKHEWKGPWSDGSKEWTAEWLQKLNHRFGDDGAFWISYEDLLRKYQVFDRTRLFGPEWKVSSIWTTLSVPWTLEYHPTRFAFRLARAGPVVIVLSQLDSRYFRGLEGQYRFDLAFRLHKDDEDDYVVRSGTTYRMNRSVNVELDLEAGDYTVLVKLDAKRDDCIVPVEQVVRANAKTRREKLIRIGLAYDLAHSKGKYLESPEEKEARKAAEERMKAKQRNKYREKMREDRKRNHYMNKKGVERQRRHRDKAKKKKRAKAEKKKAEAEEKKKAGKEQREKEKQHKKDKKEEKREKEVGGQEPQNDKEAGTATPTPAPPKLLKEESSSTKRVTIALPEAHEEKKEVAGKDTDSNNSTEPGQSTPSVSNSEADRSEIPAPEGKLPVDDEKEGNTQQAGPKSGPPVEESFHTAPGDADDGEGVEPAAPADVNAENVANASTQTDLQLPPVDGVGPSGPPDGGPGSGAEDGETSEAEIAPDVRRADGQGRNRSSRRNRDNRMRGGGMPPPGPPRGMGPMGPMGPMGAGRGPGFRPGPVHMHSGGMPPPPGPYFGPPHRGPPHFGYPPTGRVVQHPRRDRWSPPGSRSGSGSSSSGSDSSDVSSVSSLSDMSDMSDRELDILIEERHRHVRNMPPHPPPRGGPFGPPGANEASAKDPWNAVAVVGLRVYYKEPEDAGAAQEEVVKLRVERPNKYSSVLKDDDDVDGGDADGKGKAGGAKSDETTEEDDEGGALDASKVLDVDDSAKDATLGDEERERRKSVATVADDKTDDEDDEKDGEKED